MRPADFILGCSDPQTWLNERSVGSRDSALWGCVQRGADPVAKSGLQRGRIFHWELRPEPDKQEADSGVFSVVFDAVAGSRSLGGASLRPLAISAEGSQR